MCSSLLSITFNRFSSYSSLEINFFEKEEIAIFSSELIFYLIDSTLDSDKLEKSDRSKYGTGSSIFTGLCLGVSAGELLFFFFRFSLSTSSWRIRSLNFLINSPCSLILPYSYLLWVLFIKLRPLLDLPSEL